MIEDRFAAGRPHYEEVGALFTDRVHDWELYKLRMLNASHSCMAYLAALAGVIYVDEAVALAALRRYLERFLGEEAIPTLAEIPGHPAADYASTVLSRFANSGVRDQIARLCIDGTAKFPSFLIPTIERELELGGPIECGALALAGWARYLAVTPAAERAPDPHGERAIALALGSLDAPLTFLELDEVFSPPLRESERFRWRSRTRAAIWPRTARLERSSVCSLKPPISCARTCRNLELPESETLPSQIGWDRHIREHEDRGATLRHRASARGVYKL